MPQSFTCETAWLLLLYLVANALSAVIAVVASNVAANTATIARYLTFILVEEKNFLFIWIKKIMFYFKSDIFSRTQRIANRSSDHTLLMRIIFSVSICYQPIKPLHLTHFSVILGLSVLNPTGMK